MRQIINQVYWDRVNASYMTGSVFKKYNNNQVNFRNYLMPSGKTLIKWSSSLNYQANKEVPRLPILLSSKRYKLSIKLKALPLNSVIFCLKFFDLQLNEIKKIVFVEKEKEFIYPTEAVTYTFEIISGGCKEIEFSKLQLSSASVPSESFEDFYSIQITKKQKSKLSYLLLIEDTIRTRELTMINLPTELDNYNVNLGYLSWQRSKETEDFLLDFVTENFRKNSIIISSSSNIDIILKDLNIQSKFISSKVFMSNKNKQIKWLNENNTPINVQKVVDESIKYLRE